MARINYPDNWNPADRDALDALFYRARKDGLWFFHGGMAGPLWFSPDELEEAQKRGGYVWGAPNWTLRDPKDQLKMAGEALKRAQAEHDRILNKLGSLGLFGA